MSKRIEFLDAAKGIGILFVVLGHNHIKLEYPAIYQVIYSFHMPFFFLLSGMFFKTDYGLVELARRRFHSLVKPFIAYMVIVYSGSILFTKIDLLTIFGRVIKALYAGSNTLEWIPLWFLPHLFLVNLFAFILIKFVYDRLPHLWMRALFLLVVLGVGVAAIQVFWPVRAAILNRSFEMYGLPWSADLLLITTPFFILGYQIKRTFFHPVSPHFGVQDDEQPSYFSWILIAAVVLFIGLHIIFQSTIDFYTRSYGSFVVNTLEAVSGSILVLYLAKWSEKGPMRLLNALKYLGEASVVILIFHLVPQEFLYPKLISLNMNMFLASALSFCAGVVFPLLLFAWVIRPNRLLSSWFGLSQPEREAH